MDRSDVRDFADLQDCCAGPRGHVDLKGCAGSRGCPDLRGGVTRRSFVAAGALGAVALALGASPRAGVAWTQAEMPVAGRSSSAQDASASAARGGLAHDTAPDYADPASWAYWCDVADPASFEVPPGDEVPSDTPAASSALGEASESLGTAFGEASNTPAAAPASSAPSKPADLFIVCPTVASGGDEGAPTMELTSEDDRANFVGALNMELGIYDGCCRVFAPYYRQATLSAYAAGGTVLDDALDLAYRDVRAAFERYCAERPAGPLVLAGFSQGADLAIRLVRDCCGDEALRERLVACYALGWRLTRQECDACSWLRAAQGELDTGVVITFNSEAPEVSGSLMVPAGTRTLAINPLSWTITSDPAPAALNLGACFTDYSGAIVSETPELCGGWLDPDRGTLKVGDISPQDYPAGLDIFEDGIYHLYDYQFFYRNLQRNVGLRLAAYQEEHAG